MAHLHLVAHDMFGVMGREALCAMITSIEHDKNEQEKNSPSGLDVTPLANMLSRADRQLIVKDRVALLARLFEIDDSATMPVAAYSYLADTGQPPAGYCLRADPVHLKADRDRVVLYRARDLLVSSNEAKQFVDEITSVLDDSGLDGSGQNNPGWSLEAAAATRWYLHLDKDIDLSTSAPDMALSGDIFHHLPTGNDASTWRSLINEMQMLLHNSPLNQLRNDGGLDTLNSLWLWGGGQYQSLSCKRWTKVMSRDPLVKGLALASQTTLEDLPATADQLQSLLIADEGDYLMVMEPCAESIYFGDIDNWYQYMRGMIERWLVPVMVMLDERKIESVTLYPGNGYSYKLTRKMLRKWWHRKKSLSTLLNSVGKSS